MKELSIEEKAKRYDEAIERVEDIVGGKCPKPFVFTEGLFDYIFPELKESEDERIRKELVQFFEEKDEEDFEEWIPKAKVLAWLEKQGEQKPQGKSALEAINEEKVDNANKVEPRQEKLTKFEKAVKQVMEEAIECGDTRNLKADAEMLLSLVHKSAWSEEGKRKMYRIYSILGQAADTHAFSTTCRLIGDKECIELQDFLKYLTPQSTWKPSDEQIKQLGWVAEQNKNNMIGKELMTLYQDLKKLRKE